MQHYELRQADKHQNDGKTDKKISDEDSYIKLVFENMKFSDMASKQMADAWIKIITNITSGNELRFVLKQQSFKKAATRFIVLLFSLGASTLWCLL